MPHNRTSLRSFLLIALQAVTRECLSYSETARIKTEITPQTLKAWAMETMDGLDFDFILAQAKADLRQTG